MNCVDFLLKQHTKHAGNFVLGRTAELSYSNLMAGVLKLSGWFNAHVGRSKNIILCMPNGPEFIQCYLAIMKSGNVVVPLNPAIEKDSFEQISKVCDAQCLILSKQVVKRLNPTHNLILGEENIANIIDTATDIDWFNTATKADDLAQIIFTSGSTARPKGVMISHNNIIANTSSIVSYLNLSEKDIVEIVLPFFYCYGLSLLHTHLKVGGSVVLNNTFIFLNSVIEDLKKYNCTGFAGVPSHFQILLRKSDSFKTTEFPCLRYVTQAGGKLHTTFIEEFCKHLPKTNFYVMYGQTEATARLSYLPPDRLADKLGSLGKGIPNVELRVVDENGAAVKPGEIGEIIAKGDNVMLGYYNEPQATANVIKNGWLYTGDLAKVDDEGFIYHAARRKEIIKVGGRRVSPKEIEEVIVGINGVIDCTVEPIENEILGEAIKATLVINKNYEQITETFVKKHCAHKLASYKVPQEICFMENLKVNAAGKKVKAEK